MKAFFKSPVDKNRIYILGLVWFLVVLYGVAYFSPESFPLQGAKGLLDVWISGPLFWFSAGYAVLLSMPKLYGSPALYVGAGVFWTAGFCQSFYISNSGFIFAILSGSEFFREANRLTRLSKFSRRLSKKYRKFKYEKNSTW